MKCADYIKPSYFYLFSHQIIYSAMLEMYKSQQPVGLIELTSRLYETEEIDKAGGAATLSELQTYVASSNNFEHWLDELKRYFGLRKVHACAVKAQEFTYSPQAKPTVIIDDIEKKLQPIKRLYYSSEIAKPISSFVPDYIEMVEHNYNNPGELSGISHGFPELDKMTGGMQQEEITLIAARTSVGKTTFMLNIACHLAFKLKIPFGFFSLEMPERQILNRISTYLSGISLHSIRSGYLSKKDLNDIAASVQKLCGQEFYIDASGRLTVQQLRSRAMEMINQYGIKCIFVDYVQLMKSSDSRHKDFERVSEISKDLKGLAKELKLPIVTAAQLNREAEIYPKLSHLRSAGDLEQDADVVALIHREVKSGNEPAKLIIGKNRNGPCGEIDMMFNGETYRFTENMEAGF